MRLLDEYWEEMLPNEISANLQELNAEIIKIICDRIKAIGKMLPADINMLNNAMQFTGIDMKSIREAIAKNNLLNEKEINRIMDSAADANREFAQQYYAHRNLPVSTAQTDAYIDNLIRAVKHSTIGEFQNLSNTYGFKFPGEQAMTLKQTYTRAIDKAIYEIQNGTLDFNTAMRRTVANLADSGLRVVNWESGVTRRTDTAARMNIIDGTRRLSQEMMSYNGEKFGSDGVELSAHAISAPDHLPIQGRQLTNEQFELMQSGQDFEDVKGNHYTGFNRPIGEWNCKHFAVPIIVGVSEPAYTDEQLFNMAQNSRNKYDITQEMRKRETELRRLKDRRMAFSAAGNTLDAQRCQRDINIKTKQYNQLCQNNGLNPHPDRTRVDGYKRISTNELKEYEKSVIITITEGGKYSVLSKKDIPMFKHMADNVNISEEDAKIIWDNETGYIQAQKNYKDINNYMRGLISSDELTYKPESLTTIERMTFVTENNTLGEAIIGTRKVGADYIANALGVNTVSEKAKQNPLNALTGYDFTDKESAQNAVDLINAKIGNVVKDKAFTSVSLIEEQNYFEGRPVKLTIQMPPETKGLVTNNVAESEFIAPPDTGVKILGARQYEHLSKQGRKNYYIEIFAKMIN